MHLSGEEVGCTVSAAQTPLEALEARSPASWGDCALRGSGPGDEPRNTEAAWVMVVAMGGRSSADETDWEA